MGITGLLPFVKKATKHSHVKHFSGQTAAIDAYGWLYKGAFGCAEKLGKGEPTTIYVTFCMKYVNVLISHGVKPVLVFDGRNLPAKAVTDEKRKQNRLENLEKAKDALRQGKPAWEYFTRCLHVTSEMARELIKVLREQKIDYIIAPYEADAQMAYLARKKIVDFVITEDSDLILFGCPKIFFKLSIYGDGVVFDASKIHLAMDQTADKFQFDKFRQMCILSGCDYLPSLPGIGLGRAKKIFQMSINPDVKQTLRQIPTVLKLDIVVPPEYLEQFVQADNTFKYQLVFDPLTRSVVPLTPYPVDIAVDELHYAGKYEKKSLALDYALGNVDIKTKERVGNFDPQDPKSGYTKTSIWVKGYELPKRPNPTTELKTNTKHTSTIGLKHSVSVGSVLKKRSLGIGTRRLRSSGELEEETNLNVSLGLAEQPEGEDLMSMYGDAETKDKKVSNGDSFEKTQSQEEEDKAILTQSSRRHSKRPNLTSPPGFYKKLKTKEEPMNGINLNGTSDGESDPDSSEMNGNDQDDEEPIASPIQNGKAKIRNVLQKFKVEKKTPSPVLTRLRSPIVSKTNGVKNIDPVCSIEKVVIKEEPRSKKKEQRREVVISQYFRPTRAAAGTQAN